MSLIIIEYRVIPEVHCLSSTTVFTTRWVLSVSAQTKDANLKFRLDSLAFPALATGSPLLPAWSFKKSLDRI